MNVVDGAQFMCDSCAAPHSVTVPSSPAKAQRKKMASESNSFIPPNGGPCQKILIAGSPTPCALPSKPDSAGQSKLKIAGALAMGSGCKYKCPAGGTLTVLSPGQTKVKAGASAGLAAGVASAVVAGVTAASGDDDDEKKDKETEAVKKAKAGGKNSNSGMLKNYENKPPKQIKKGIDSIEKQVQHHKDKISDPVGKGKIPDFYKKDPREQTGIIKKWHKDIARQEKQKEVLEHLLKTKS